MKKSVRQLAQVCGTALLALFVALGGCGKDSTVNQEAADLAALAQTCNDGCNTMLLCAQEVHNNAIPAEDAQQLMTVCLDECIGPDEPEDVEVRDCALACDLNTECVDFVLCICACGIEIVEGCT